ncbi:hypothetical protein MRX96_057230 [Rhipicephalus microplus]
MCGGGTKVWSIQWTNLSSEVALPRRSHFVVKQHRARSDEDDHRTIRRQPPIKKSVQSCAPEKEARWRALFPKEERTKARQPLSKPCLPQQDKVPLRSVQRACASRVFQSFQST